MPKNAENYDCIKCNFRCSKLSNWNTHLATRKHQFATICNRFATEKMPDEGSSGFCCENCKKEYKERTAFWRHKKKCFGVLEPLETEKTPIHVIDCEIVESSVSITPDMMLDMMKQNQDLQLQIIALSKKIQDAPSTVVNNTNTNSNNTTSNNQFNLNVYLNNTCKNALNFTDFLQSIDLTQDDLQTVIKHGYHLGHSMIIVNQFDKLDVHERPIQCSDPKRGVTHVKNNDIWNIEGPDQPHIKKLVDTVTHKTTQQFCIWNKENPDPANTMIDTADESDRMHNESKKMRDEKLKYMNTNIHIMKQVNGNGNDTEIHKNIITHVTIDKDKERERNR